jgi:hypothetical protein
MQPSASGNRGLVRPVGEHEFICRCGGQDRLPHLRQSRHGNLGTLSPHRPATASTSATKPAGWHRPSPPGHACSAVLCAFFIILI